MPHKWNPRDSLYKSLLIQPREAQKYEANPTTSCILDPHDEIPALPPEPPSFQPVQSPASIMKEPSSLTSPHRLASTNIQARQYRTPFRTRIAIISKHVIPSDTPIKSRLFFFFSSSNNIAKDQAFSDSNQTNQKQRHKKKTTSPQPAKNTKHEQKSNHCPPGGAEAELDRIDAHAPTYRPVDSLGGRARGTRGEASPFPLPERKKEEDNAADHAMQSPLLRSESLPPPAAEPDRRRTQPPPRSPPGHAAGGAPQLRRGAGIRFDPGGGATVRKRRGFGLRPQQRNLQRLDEVRERER